MSANVDNLHGDGAILLLSCYELGHIPAGITWPAAFLQRAGFAPKVIDLAICELDEEAVRAAKLVAISVPMHTALRLAVPVAQRIRSLNAAAHICFHGLYAQINHEWLLGNLANSCRGGESEQALVGLAQALARGEAPAAVAAPLLARQ
ncbi:MAG: CUAEP/CCAEP-tail radical SAM protein, partial [Candidatus Thermoplasmatota archaeon]|nr:CUAEP/CCAEP-tail radical SAM protein [Candidatus Thermoplasmatota archaeon]